MGFSSHASVPLWREGKEFVTSTTFDIITPISGKTLYPSSSASIEEAEAAIQSAQTAFKTWSKTKPSQRRDILLRAAGILDKRRDELFSYTNQETGATDTMFNFDINLAIEACKNVAGLISSTVTGKVTIVADDGRSAMVLKEPYGVVLSIAPWNAPYILGLRACLGPLAMGNTVVFKGSEISPATVWAISSVLHEAGLPSGCLNTIVHRPKDAAAVTSAIIASPLVKKITFTGSTGTGAIIASLAGKHLKPTLMELGGKAPTIVCDDADLGKAALGTALGAFLHAGQICMAAERVIVHKAVVEKFTEAFKATVTQIFGQPEGLISANETGPTKNRKLIQDAVSKGATVVFGDPSHIADVPAAMRPVILSGVSKSMDIYYTESFGPSISMFVVKTDDEAITLANDTEYGLASSVYTENLQRGLRIARQLETRAVHVNAMSVHDESALPHGGAKKSGYGRFNSAEGLEEWVRTKSVTWQD